MVHVKRVKQSDYGLVQVPAQVTLSSGHILNMAVELIGRAIAGDPDSAYYHSDLVRTYATLEDKK